jgi:signal transduction histidine kinase
VVRRVASALRRSFPETVTLTVEVETDACVALEDDGLERILLNLCTNARDAIEGEGTIVLRVVPEPEGVAIVVEDDGHGMSPEVLQRCFEPFYSTKNAAGVGLGLSTAYRLVTEAGGTIEPRSEEGRGSVFRVTLPRAQATRTA